jgi:hypothetical protein
MLYSIWEAEWSSILISYFLIFWFWQLCVVLFLTMVMIISMDFVNFFLFISPPRIHLL